MELTILSRIILIICHVIIVILGIKILLLWKNF